MRTIDARPEPIELSNWRARCRGDVNFGYEMLPVDVREKVKESLIRATN